MKISGKDMLIVDFSGQKETEMIHLLQEVKSYINIIKRPHLVMNIFDRQNTFSASVIECLFALRSEVRQFIIMEALVGLTSEQEDLIGGYLKQYDGDLVFPTRDEAFRYLLNEPAQSKTSRDSAD